MLQNLPVDAVTDEVAAALQSSGMAVLQAPTGTGKTTRVPIALLKAGLAESGQIVMLQPRRVAARSTARTMAQNLGEDVGQTVGYQVRFDRKASRATRVMVMTEGLLTRKFARDPMLEDVSLVILDEFHERSLDTDLALAFLKTLRDLRDDLRILVMSATLETHALSRFLDEAPIIKVKAPTYPIQITYRDHLVTQDWGGAVRDGLEFLLANHDDNGDILVFLPGVGEIERVAQDLEAFKQLEVLKLHGRLNAQEQDRIFQKSRMRRIVLATNIAETSLTIPGVTAVIDTGYRRQASFDVKRGIDRLDLARISQASATQRAGRAGRTAPGRVIRLWSESLQQALEGNDPPEVQRLDLTSWLLSIIDYHGPHLDDFPFFEKPEPQRMKLALRLLRDLGALDDEDRITEKGRRLLQLPLHPRQACLLETANADGGADFGAALCAMLSEGYRAQGAVEDTVTAVVKSNRNLPRRLLQVYQQLQRQQKLARNDATNPKAQLGKWALSGYPDRLCRVDAQGEGRMVGGRGVQITDYRGKTEYVVALDVSERGHNRQAAKVDAALQVTFEQIEEVLPIEVRDGAIYDSKKDLVRGMRTWRFHDLVLQEQPTERPDDAACGAVLASVAANQFDVLFRPDKDAARLRDRVLFAAKYVDDPDWPDFSYTGICQHLPQALYGKRKLEDVRKLNWRDLFMTLLSWPQQQLLDQIAPSHIEVPSGSRVALDYSQVDEAAGAPILAVRLQEMFGQTETPRVGRGQVPVLLHLLAPNMRPVQVTQDLENFWNNTYTEVRKELRQRYLKHSWPEDPWTAEAIRGTKKQNRK